MKPKTIMFIGWEFPPRGGGVGAYMANMARALIDAGHKALMVTGRMPGSPDEENDNGLVIYRVYDQAQRGKQDVIKRILDLAEKHDVDWIEGSDHLGECAGLLKMRSRPPVVIKVHGCSALGILRDSHILKAWQRPVILLSILRQWRTIFAEKYCIQRADLLLTPSWRMACEISRIQWNLTNSLSVVPNTISAKPFIDTTEADRPTILFVGRIDIGKGIQWLPSIMKNLRQKNVLLEIAGGDSYARGIGSLRSWLERKLAYEKIDVRFLGKVSQEHLSEAYQRAWVVILPSRWDNFPTIILEAMQHGKPVVSSPYGGMVEMLTGTRSRIALPDSPDFSRQIDAFLADADLRREAGLSMQEKLKAEFSSQKVVEKYIQAVTSGLSLH